MKVKYRIRKRKSLTIEEMVSLTTDYSAGLAILDIMKKYQISRATIYNVLKKEIN
jgi:Mor family transcriptional regulator